MSPRAGIGPAVRRVGCATSAPSPSMPHRLDELSNVVVTCKVIHDDDRVEWREQPPERDLVLSRAAPPPPFGQEDHPILEVLHRRARADDGRCTVGACAKRHLLAAASRSYRMAVGEVPHRRGALPDGNARGCRRATSSSMQHGRSTVHCTRVHRSSMLHRGREHQPNRGTRITSGNASTEDDRQSSTRNASRIP